MWIPFCVESTRRGAATHPVEPEAPEPDGAEPVAPNPSHLPIEPEFAPDWRPALPEAPGTKPPLP